MPTFAIAVAVPIVVFFVLITSTVNIVQEYERGVIFRLGRLVGARRPGLFFLIPGAERMQKIDLRIVTHEVPAREAIGRVTLKVNRGSISASSTPRRQSSKRWTISGPRPWSHRRQHSWPI